MIKKLKYTFFLGVALLFVALRENRIGSTEDNLIREAHKLAEKLVDFTENT